jgi:hypothetical protein
VSGLDASAAGGGAGSGAADLDRPEALAAGGQLYVFAGGEQSAGAGTPAALPPGGTGAVGAVAVDGSLQLFTRTAEGTLARATAKV